MIPLTPAVIEPNNEVRVYPCPTWADFTIQVRMVQHLNAGDDRHILPPRSLFRGHSNPTWRLQSRLERLLSISFGRDGLRTASKKSERSTGSTDSKPGAVLHSSSKATGLALYDEYCSELLSRFREHAHGRPGFQPSMSDDEMWALGRHFGLITPLLDWSESPYVAAYFALEELLRRMERHANTILAPLADTVHVWGLRIVPGVEKDGEFEIVAARPPWADRQRAQSGLFTRLRTVSLKDLVEYLSGRRLAHCLERYDIRANAAVPGIRDLQLMNITPATLYPDLTGAALQANIASEVLEFGSMVLQEAFERRPGDNVA